MASATVNKKLREEATCPICLELMTEPMSIDCGHSYCHMCILKLTGNRSSEKTSLGTFHCPQCRKPFKSDNLRPNKELGNISETIKESLHKEQHGEQLHQFCDDESLCKKHGEKLHLFCEDDGQLICWRCERTPLHREHVTALVEEACQGYWEQLQKVITELKVTRSKYQELKLEIIQKICSWEETTKREEERIHSEFKNLHTFLHQEEESLLCQLKNKKEKKLSRLKDNVTHLDNKLEQLKNDIQELDKKCQGSAQNLLQDIKDTLGRVSAINLERPENVSLELHTVPNVSELYFSVRKVLKYCQENVTLDPYTAQLKVCLSDNQRTVAFNGILRMPQTLTGFIALPCILGRERFTSGRHYFEVSVKEGIEWGAGVCLENVPRGIDIRREPQSGFWAIRLRKDNKNLVLTSPPTALYLKDQPKVVGIVLDCDAGLVSFYNATTGFQIYTFPKASFSHALRPYFELSSNCCLSLTSSNE